MRKVETDPPHYYWLCKLKDKELDVAEQDRIRLLKTAVTWPGAPVHTLRFIAEELDDPDGRVWSRKARERADERESRLRAQRPDVVEVLTKQAEKRGKQQRRRPKKPVAR